MKLGYAFTLDAHVVEFDPTEGWRCSCATFERVSFCDHTSRAATIHGIERSVMETGRRIYSIKAATLGMSATLRLPRRRTIH